jgi:methyl-accepting chemotaxis protein
MLSLKPESKAKHHPAPGAYPLRPIVKKLSKLRLSFKLPAAITALVIVMMVGLSELILWQSGNALMKEAEISVSNIAASQADAVDEWMAENRADAGVLAQHPAITGAAFELQAAFALTAADPKAYLQRLYIEESPHPAGERKNLDQAEDGSNYSAIHAKYHPALRQLATQWEFDDIFLISLQGDILYTVAKETDFAANLKEPALADSGLAQVFAQAMADATGQIYVSDFEAYAPSNGAYAAFLATAILDGAGRPTAVLAIQVPSHALTNAAQSAQGLGESGEVYIIGPDGLARNASRREGLFALGSTLQQTPQLAAALADEERFFAETIGQDGEPVLAATHKLKIDGLDWFAIAEVDRAEKLAGMNALQRQSILLIAAGVAIAAFAGWLLSRTITGPLARLGASMQAVAAREYEKPIAGAERGDELGSLAAILGDFRDRLAASDSEAELREKARAEQAKVMGELRVALKQLSDGNLAHILHEPFAGEYEELRGDFNATLETLNRIVGAVVENAEHIRRRAQEISASSEDLSRRTENQAATLEETAAALDELTSSVRNAASNAVEVEKVVQSTRSEAEANGEVVREAVEAMSEIKNSSEEISQIIGVIDDIAFQTNLLALNAGVEAARAGEAGKGFAVVASEVRALAQRSSEAAKQIKSLIISSSNHVQRGVGLVGKAGETLIGVVEQVGNISRLISDIAGGAKEQATGLGEINIGVTQLDQVTQQNAAMVEEATAAGQALNQDAAHLAELVARFRLMAAEEGPRASSVAAFRRPEEPAEASAPTAKARAAGGAKASASSGLAEGSWHDF